MDKQVEPFIEEMRTAVTREQAVLAGAGKPTEPLPPAYFLAISGGGDAGAFGAGLLVGWTAHGTRPQFKVVTGISTGAVIAPFAFLGPKYDATLQTVYTTLGPRDVYAERSLLAVWTSDGMADNLPLYRSSRMQQFCTLAALDAMTLR